MPVRVHIKQLKALPIIPSGYTSGGGGGSNVTASNGLTKVGNDIQLGGTLIKDTDISGTDFNFNIETVNTANGKENYLILDDEILLNRYNNISGQDVSMQIDEIGVVLQSFDSVGNATSFQVGTSGVITAGSDQPSFGGIQYDNNYSTKFTSLSLPSAGWVTGLTSVKLNTAAFNVYSGATLNYIRGAKTYTGTQTFLSSGLELNNPANTFQYIFTGAAIVADRTVAMPLLTANDTMVTATFTQTLTNKTFGTGSRILLGSDATGDLHYNSGSGVLARLAPGAAGTVLTSNGAGVAPSYQSVGSSVTANNGLTKVGNNIRLGGTLTGDTIIDNGAYTFGIGDGLTRIIGTDTTNVYLATEEMTFQMSTIVAGNEAIFEDSRLVKKGIKYGGDYSSGFEARSLPDTAFVTGLTTQVKRGNLSTTDGGTAIVNLALPDNGVIGWSAMIIAKRSSTGYGKTLVIQGNIGNDSGTAFLNGSPSYVSNVGHSSLSAIQAVFTANGTNLRLTVTGSAGLGVVNWLYKIDYLTIEEEVEP